MSKNFGKFMQELLSVFYTLIFLFISFNSAFCQESTYQFLLLDMSPRAASLGGSFVSNNDDPDVIFYNPAGMEFLDNTVVSFSFVKYLLDINFASFSYSTEINNIGRFGAAIRYANYGTFTGADDFGNLTGDYTASEGAILLGYSNLLDENFSYGASLELIYSTIAGRSSSGIAMDLGLHYQIPANLIDVGFSILNAGTQMKSYYSTKENLPVAMAFGVSKKMEHIPVRISLDFHDLYEQDISFVQRLNNFSLGAEFFLSRVIRLRFGYDNQNRTDLTIGQSAGLAGISLGLGVVISGYTFDYGFSSLGQIGALHRIGVTTTL
jgi:hypothetical protein